MGNFEKLVVLTVLFLVAIVLGVSLNAPSDVAAAGEIAARGPLEAARARLDESGARDADADAASLASERPSERDARVAQTPPASDPAAAETFSWRTDATAPVDGGPAARESGRSAPGGPATTLKSANPAAPGGSTLAASGRARPTASDPALLSSTVSKGSAVSKETAARETAAQPTTTPTTTQGRPAGERASGAPPRIVRDDPRLEPTAHPDYRIYAWSEGDTWTGLSQLAYGSARFVNQLRASNEGRETPRAGTAVLVPVHDLGYDAGARPAAEPAASRAASAPVARTHEVRDGESLWVISKRHYGTGTRWTEIFEANRDVLPSADSLKVGTVLRIP